MTNMEKEYFEDKFGGLHGKDTYTPIGRIAFVYLVNPNTYQGDGKANSTYSVSILISKEKDAQTDAVVEKIKKELKPLQDAWVLKEHKKTPKVPFDKFREAKLVGMAARPWIKDGDMKTYEGFAGHNYIQANNKVRDGKGGILFLDGRAPEEFEGGMICRLQLTPRVDSNGFSWKLKAIRLIQDDGFRFNIASGPPDLLSGLDDAVAAATASLSQDSKGPVMSEKQADDSLMAEYDKALAATSNPTPAAKHDLAVL